MGVREVARGCVGFPQGKELRLRRYTENGALWEHSPGAAATQLEGATVNCQPQAEVSGWPVAVLSLSLRLAAW